MKIKRFLKYISGVLAITFYMFIVLALTQAVLITQDNQDSLNEMTIRINELQSKKLPIRRSAVSKVEQWLGDRLK